MLGLNIGPLHVSTRGTRLGGHVGPVSGSVRLTGGRQRPAFNPPEPGPARPFRLLGLGAELDGMVYGLSVLAALLCAVPTLLVVLATAYYPSAVASLGGWRWAWGLAPYAGCVALILARGARRYPPMR